MADSGYDPGEPFYRAIGEAMQAYAGVEATQASILEVLLKIDFQRAHAIFFSAQNVRSRNELFETLLELDFRSDLNKYWASCGAFLLKLAQFRNAIAHWHPYVNIYVGHYSDKTKAKHALGHPILGKNFDSLEEENFPPFLKDCQYIREELSALILFLKERPSPLPEKFQQPIARRNQAVLRPSRKPKAQQPQRPPSVPKLSAAQKRAKALKDARPKQS